MDPKDLHLIGKTPINTVELEKALRNCPNKDLAYEVVNGFRFGFSLNYRGPIGPSDCKNLKSARQNVSELWLKVSDEISKGRISGPYMQKPLVDLKVSPVGLIPKSDGISWRLITDLSHPKHESVNDFIPLEFRSVEYTKFDTVIDIVQSLGENAQMGKIDLKSAFRICPIRPSDFQFFGLVGWLMTS